MFGHPDSASSADPSSPPLFTKETIERIVAEHYGGCGATLTTQLYNNNTLPVTSNTQLSQNKESSLSLWYEACQDFTLLITAIAQMVPNEKASAIYVSHVVYSIYTLHDLFFNLKTFNSTITENNKKLLLLPVMVDSGTATSQPNHYTLLIVDLDVQKYYYQDSIGQESNYGIPCHEIHKMMSAFFENKQINLSAAKPESPSMIKDKLDARFKKNQYCVSYTCCKQQNNTNDCGPAVIDNIYAVLQAHLQGWPIELFPAIICMRYHIRGLPNYDNYYREVRKQHNVWETQTGGNIIQVESDQLKLQQRKSFAANIYQDSTNYVDYWSNLIRSFYDSIDLLECLPFKEIIAQLHEQRRGLIYHEHIQASHFNIMGAVLNLKFSSDANLSSKAADLLLREYQQQFNLPRHSSQAPLSGENGRFVYTKQQRHQRMPSSIPENKVANIWQNFVGEEGNLQTPGLRQIAVTSFQNAQQNLPSKNWGLISNKFQAALIDLQIMLNALFPAELRNIAGKPLIQADFLNHLQQQLNAMQQVYQNIGMQQNYTAQQLFKKIKALHEKIIKACLNQKIISEQLIRSDYLRVQDNFSDIFKKANSAQGACSIS
jgi:hypothetical protein